MFIHQYTAAAHRPLGHESDEALMTVRTDVSPSPPAKAAKRRDAKRSGGASGTTLASLGPSSAHAAKPAMAAQACRLWAPSPNLWSGEGENLMSARLELAPMGLRQDEGAGEIIDERGCGHGGSPEALKAGAM